MDIVNEKFIETLTPVSRGEKASAASSRLQEMKVGDILFVSREEWKESGYTSKFPTWVKAKYNPARHASHKWAGFEVRTYLEGWVVRRNAPQPND